MSDSVRKIKISSYDDLFSPTDSNTAETGSPLNIDVEKLVPFPHHPFKLYHEDKMQEMVQSIRNNGVLTPILVRPTASAEGYEIISGHNRVSAARLAGLSSIPAIIRNLDDESAIVAMVDSNLRQREQLLPSEKAFAFKMKLDAIKKKSGTRTDLTCGQVDHRLSNRKSRDQIAEDSGESPKQIQRFIRLTELITPLLDFVDQGHLAFNPAVAISYLTAEQQTDVLDLMNQFACSPSLAQAERLKTLSQSGQLDWSAINAILGEQKPQQSQIVLKSEQIAMYFPKDTSPDQIQDTIIKLLDTWYRRRNQDVAR
ncbi:MAG: ParB/RepB/Spo0J family partition protein [Clostridiaceae bacterium]|nr:ParB/RepB/Spo0J family partition protein [Clostridiaceae bacterium]